MIVICFLYMKMWGSWNLKELVFWNWFVRIIPQTRFIGVSASRDRVVTDGENWAPGRRLWLSGKHMFIYGRQPPLSSQSCCAGSGPRVPDLLSFQEKKNVTFSCEIPDFWKLTQFKNKQKPKQQIHLCEPNKTHLWEILILWTALCSFSTIPCV